MKRLWRLICSCLACVGIAPTAFAISPVSTATALCGNTYVVTAKIIAAVNRDCRLSAGPNPCPDPYSGRHELEITLVVTGILGVHADRLKKAEDALRVGQTVRTMIRAWVGTFNGEKFVASQPPSFSLPADKVLSQGWIDAGYVGQEYILAGVFSHHASEEVAATWKARRSPSAEIWPLEKKAWILETMMKQPNCLTLL